ncbi:MAG: hypothetical protein ABSB42_01265 [Tepidisphaeraceae bacterium]|jgi:hypothetical protein
MKYAVKSACGFYTNVNRKPGWVQTIKDAKHFPSIAAARTVVRIIARNNIKATVVPLPAIGAPMRK